MRKWVVSVAAVVIGLLLYRRCGDEPVVEAPPTAKLAPKTVAKAAERERRTGELGLRLEGQVVDREGPVGGVTVELAEPRRQVVSEQDGSFAFDGLVAGVYTLSATAESLYAEELQTTLSAASDPVTLHVVPAGSVTVTVTDADSGQPIGNASVSDGRHAIATDAAGRAHLGGLPVRTVELEASAPEHAPAKLRVQIGVDHERTVVLQRGAPVSGTVVAPGGEPVGGAAVELEGRGWRGEVRADGAGRWRVPALARGSYSITASSERYTDAEDIVVKVDGMHPRDGVIVPVALGGELDGLVTDDENHPIPGARIRADSGSFEPLFTTADATGRFHLQGMPRGTYQVWAATAQQASMRATATLVEAGRLELQLTVRDSTLAGTVVDRAGPVANAHVTARSDLTVVEARSDADGHFDLGAVPLGAYQVWARRSSSIDGVPVTAQAGDHGVTLTLR